MTIFCIFIFLFGLTVGSFLNCFIYRMEKKKSVLRGRSFCPKCKHQLAWYDLIPVVSFFILKGKCRYCKKTISWQYPLIELATGLLFVLVFWHLGFGIYLDFGPDLSGLILGLIFLLAITSILIVVFVYDLKHYIIPDKVVFSGISLVFLYQLLENYLVAPDLARLENFILTAFAAATFFLLIVLITKGKGMGLGDVKLAFLMGLLLGWPNIFVAMFFAFLIGAIIGVGLILAKKKTLKSEIPFGPFLVTGTFIALFWSQELINWYLNLFI